MIKIILMILVYVIPVAVIGFMGFKFLAKKVAEKTSASKISRWKKKVIETFLIIGCIAYIAAVIFVGIKAFYPRIEKYHQERLASLSECERNGCQIKYEKYHNVFEERWDVIEVLKDTESEETPGRNLIWFDKEKEVYQFFCEQKYSARKWETISADATKLYPIVENESAYVEIWRQYGEYCCCSVCGANESYKWSVPFYKVYYVEGDIVEEKTLPQE